MKSLFIAFFVVLFVSCNSDDNDISINYRAENEQEIVAYIDLHELEAIRTETGLYYVVDEIGEGVEITATSDISIRVKLSYTDGTLIDQSPESGFSINLQETIAGWKEGLQKFHEGGSGKLLVPAHLAFGSKDQSGIPGGSVLIYEFELIDYDVENKQEIVEYIEENELDAIESDTGLFYVIDEQGSGAQPTESSNVTVAYKGYFTDGNVFDESSVSGASFNLNQVIPGWIEGIQYFNEGGSGILLVPSSLAYGRYGNQLVPGGSVLIFEVELKSVN